MMEPCCRMWRCMLTMLLSGSALYSPRSSSGRVVVQEGLQVVLLGT
jgi:hypothetical protein